MSYTGTDLNKAEKGYVDEQDQALQDQIDLADFVTELDANDFDAESYFKVEDDGSGTNNVFVPKTIAEMKADLGLPDVYQAVVLMAGSAGDVEFTILEHIDTIGITLTFAKYNTTAGLYSFTALAKAITEKGAVFIQGIKSSDYTKKYSLELYTTGTSTTYQLRVYKDGVLADLDNGDTMTFLIKMEKY